MLKLVKMVSVLTVLLAVLTVGMVGYLMVFGNARINEHADLLAEDSAIEIFLKALGTNIPTKNQQSPLVTQAIKLEERDRPVKPPVVITKSSDENTIKGPSIPVIEPIVITPKFSLLGTCVYEDFPEKSLALVDETTGHKWVRQGDKLDHFIVHKIEENSVTLYQDGHEATVINLPEQPKSNLLVNKNAATPKAEGIEAIKRILKPNLPKTNVKSTIPAKTNTLQPPDQRPKTTPKKESTKETIAAIEGMIKETENLPDKDKQADDMKIWTEVLKMLESSSKAEEKSKAEREKKSREKESREKESREKESREKESREKEKEKEK